MYFDDPAAVLPICIERLGEHAGRQFAALARKGFLLQRPAEAAAATGGCRLGGPALLEPGDPWPAVEGFPLSLLAVLDIEVLAALVDFPLPLSQRCVLNFFHLDLELPWSEHPATDFRDPATWRVVPADSLRAVEAAAPAPARVYPAVPVHAAAVAMLPDACDVEEDEIEFDKSAYWGVAELLWSAMKGLDSNTADRHCAFGWPDNSYAGRVTDRDEHGPLVHLLQLARDNELGWSWGDAATLYFTIPAAALAAGDFAEARMAVGSG